MVTAAVQADVVLQEHGISVNDMIRNAAILFYIENELLSFIENAGETGIPTPDMVINTVKALKGRNKKKGERERMYSGYSSKTKPCSDK